MSFTVIILPILLAESKPLAEGRLGERSEEIVDVTHDGFPPSVLERRQNDSRRRQFGTVFLASDLVIDRIRDISRGASPRAAVGGPTLGETAPLPGELRLHRTLHSHRQDAASATRIPDKAVRMCSV